MAKKTPESKVKDRVVAVLKKHEAYYFFPTAGMVGFRTGVPDIVCCYLGQFIDIECKAGKAQPTGLQFQQLSNINAAGGIALVINEDNIDALDGLLGDLREAAQ